MTEENKNLPDGWKEKKLVDYLEKIIDYRGKTPKKSNSGILTLSAKSVKMGKIDYSQAYYISPEEYDKFMVRGFPRKGDVLMTTEAPLGCIAKLDRDDVSVAQRLLTLRGKEGFLDNDYLMYYLMSAKGQHELLTKASGSTVQGIKRTEFQKVQIILPPLPEQKAIASVLSSIDDKIELLREQNETLEQMAQTIFNEWFGKYDVDNELPEGWRIGSIEEIIERQSIGYRCKQTDIDKSGSIPIIDQGSNGLYGYTSKNPDFEASFEKPVVVFANHTCNVWFVDYPFCAIQNIIPFYGKNGYDEYFIYFLTKDSIDFIEYKGHWPNFIAKDFIIPSVNDANKFSEIAKPILKKISQNNSQIQSLSKLRDTILPRLMSGEVRVY